MATTGSPWIREVDGYALGADDREPGVAQGDFDLDGHDDIAVTRGALLVLRGTPDGLSTTAAWFSSTPARGAVTIGDGNGDGFDDLMAIDGDALGSYYQEAQRTFHGTGDASIFESLDGDITFRDLPYSAHFVSLATGPFDFVRDGRGDVLVVTEGDSSLYEEREAYVYTTGANGAISKVTNLTAPGDELIAAAVPVAPVGDVDGNGDDEVGACLEVGRDAVRTLRVAMTTAESSAIDIPFATATLCSAVQAAGDVDGDGFDDLWVGDSNGPPLLFRGGVDGVIPTATTPLALPNGQSGAYATSAGDLNGDGHVDALLVAFDVPLLEVHLGDGSGAFTGPVATYDLPRAAPAPFTRLDFDGDGLDDVLLRDAGGIRPLYGHTSLGLTSEVDSLDGGPFETATGDTGTAAPTGDTGSSEPEPVDTASTSDTFVADTAGPALIAEPGTTTGGGGCGCSSRVEAVSLWQLLARRR